MITLQNVTKGGKKLPVRIVAYGTDGIGKSTFAADSIRPIFVCTEDGATRLDVPQFPKCEKWEDIFDCLRALAQEKHDYKTVVIDTLDWAQHLAIEYIIRTEYEGDGGKFDAYGSGYKILMREWRKLLSAVDFLRTRCDMESILLLHATIRPFSNPMGDNYDIYKASLVDSPSTSIWGLTKEWADLVLFLNVEVRVKKASPKSSKGKGVMIQTRYIYTKPSAAYDAKVRAGWDLPDRIELNYKRFRAYLDKQKPSETNTETDTDTEVNTDTHQKENETETTENKETYYAEV